MHDLSNNSMSLMAALYPVTCHLPKTEVVPVRRFEDTLGYDVDNSNAPEECQKLAAPSRSRGGVGPLLSPNGCQPVPHLGQPGHRFVPGERP